MTFNPSAYVLTASETLERKKQRDLYVAANKHLAMPFPILGLENKFPPVQLGEICVFGAPSHQGKSLFLKHWIFTAQKSLDESRRRAVIAYVSHEDTGDRTAAQQVKKYKNEMEYEDDLFIFIGRSFGMKAEDIAELYMTNIIRALEYASQNKFADKMPFAMIGYDFMQKAPPDPERRKMNTDTQRRFQVADDANRLSMAATYFSCPVIAAAQTKLKGDLQSAYSKEMPIAGDGDFEEAKEIFQFADHVYSGWLPRKTYQVGEHIDSGAWSFDVTPNLYFIRSLKSRYCDPEEWSGIGKVYPLFIQPDGSFVYDVEYHKSIFKGKVKNVSLFPPPPTISRIGRPRKICAARE